MYLNMYAYINGTQIPSAVVLDLPFPQLICLASLPFIIVCGHVTKKQDYNKIRLCNFTHTSAYMSYTMHLKVK